MTNDEARDVAARLTDEQMFNAHPAVIACQNAQRERPRLSHAQLVPFLIAEREAWIDIFGPALKAQVLERRRLRDIATITITAGLDAIDADNEQRSIVEKVTGLAILQAESAER